MGVINKIKQLIVKSLSTNGETFIPLNSNDPQVYRLLGTDYRFGTQSKDFLIEAYGMNPYVFMVIDRICQRLVQIEKRIIDRNGQEIENPEFLELVQSPNVKEDGGAYLYRAAATYLTTGECFLVRKQEPDEKDQYFVPINYNVTINEDTNGNVLSYWITEFGKSTTYLPNEVEHIYKPDITLDTNHGFSTLRATRKVWESNNEVWTSEAALHHNKGVSGVLYSDGNIPLREKERQALQDQYDKEFTGAERFGKVKVTTEKLGYIPMGMNPNDLKSIETRIEHLRTICAAFNTDSKLFGDPAASTYNNMAEAKRAFIIDAVIPLGKVILPRMAKFMARSIFSDYSMMLVEENIPELQITQDQKSARLGREVIQGILRPDQAAAMLYPEMIEELEEEGKRVRNDISVSDILDIQSRLAREEITREGAIAILATIYGFEEAAANEILGQ